MGLGFHTDTVQYIGKTAAGNGMWDHEGLSIRLLLAMSDVRAMRELLSRCPGSHGGVWAYVYSARHRLQSGTTHKDACIANAPHDLVSLQDA